MHDKTTLPCLINYGNPGSCDQITIQTKHEDD